MPLNTTLHEIENCFGPSAFSAEGFLGCDSRSFTEILHEDAEQLSKLGTSIPAVVSALRTLHIAAEQALEAPVRVYDEITAIHYEARGTIPSPVPGDGVYDKGETHISDTATGQTIIVSPLSLHLIEQFGFFQGKGSRYRVEPNIAWEIAKKIQ